MEFNELESFLMVEKYRSFSKAADQLYLSQPTISNNIRNLEKSLNTTLFDRRGRNVRLTSSGEVFLKYALELIDLRDKSVHNVKEYSLEISGNLEINTSSAPEEFVIPYIIKDFLQIYPEVKFSVFYHNSKDIINAVLEGKKSFGIVGKMEVNPSLEYIPFYKDEVILAVADNKNFKNFNEQVDMNLLLKHKFIFREEGSGTRSFIEDKLMEKNFYLEDLNVVSIVDNSDLIKKMIELDLGISFLSKMSIENERKLSTIKALKIKDLDLSRHFYFVYNKNRTLSPTVKAFKDFLVNWENKSEELI